METTNKKPTKRESDKTLIDEETKYVVDREANRTHAVADRQEKHDTKKQKNKS